MAGTTTKTRSPSTWAGTLLRPGRGLPEVVGAPATHGNPPGSRSLARFFVALARLRHGRAIHKRGQAFSATLTVTPPAQHRFGIALFDEPGAHPALARLSRGFGFPPPLPDILGLAFRVGAQDLLLSSCGVGRVMRHVPILRTRWGHGPVGIIAAACIGNERYQLAAFGAPPRFDLAWARPFGRWHRGLATLELHEPLSQSDGRSLRFTPFHAGEGIRPWGPIHALSRLSYSRSQQARS